jgi:two-component system response regulator AtoC
MAATHRDLRVAVREGRFREDLYYRLNVVTLSIPPLRERREDIVPIAERFLHQSSQTFRKKIQRISPAAQKLLRDYSFPGNIRELSNIIERAVLFCSGPQLEVAHFSSELIRGGVALLASAPSEGSPDPSSLSLSFRMGEDTLEGFEQRLIREVLSRAGGNKTRAADFLGISRWALDRRLKGGLEEGESNDPPGREKKTGSGGL